MPDPTAYPPPPGPGLSGPAPPPAYYDPDPGFSPYLRLPVGEVLGDCFGLFFKNIGRYTFIVGLVYLPFILWLAYVTFGDPFGLESAGQESLDAALEAQMESLLYQALAVLVPTLLLMPVATGAIIYAVFRAKKGERASVGKCLAVGFGRIFPLVGVAIVTMLIILFAAGVPLLLGILMAFGGLGLLTFLLALGAIVIGVMLHLALFVAPPAVVVEKAGVFDAISRSFALTKGSRGRIFGVVIVLGIAEKIVDWISSIATIDSPEVGFVISVICLLAFGAIGAIAPAAVFYYLKVGREGMDEDELASVFD
ncbi:MAG: hypothetical protein JXR96_30865 [Deltaproteobacteria bacterium]|nr:hypothetical protein [Deltaproteobacteria bacterium]